MITVLLYGHLGRRFGRVHRYDIRTPAEAVRALSATRRGFRAHLIEHSRPGYRVLVGREPRDLETLTWPADGVIRIVPVTAGAGRGLGSILLGAALIGASFFAPTTPLFSGLAGTAGAISASSLAFGLGASLVLGGIAQMLAPSPRNPGLQERPENRPSFAFDGAINTTGQGNPVPVGYGRLIVGSQVVSAGLAAEEIP